MLYYSFSDTVFIAIVWTLSLCGFMINGFLLFMIVFKSPAHLSPYRIFLANTAITQLLADIVYVLISPRVLSGGLYIVVIYLGPSYLLGKDVCRMLYAAMVHLSLNAFLSWMISMVYRCIILLASEIKTRTVILMCLTAYIIPASIMVTSANLDTYDNATEADILTHRAIPNMQDYPLVVISHILQPGLFYSISCSTVLLIPIYLTMYACRWKIYSVLNNKGYSSQTKLSVKQLVKSSTLTLGARPEKILNLKLRDYSVFDDRESRNNFV
ncbi:7TM chemoreceptor [Ostertagia ostertagi]